MNKTEHQMLMLTRAEKGGEPVHPGLRIDQGHEGFMGSSICQWCGVRNPPGYSCSERPITPNPMALIAAICSQGWTMFSGPSEIGGKICVEINMLETIDKDTDGIHNVHAHTVKTALTEALFQATEALDPDNWASCPGDGTNEDAICLPGRCALCMGIGMVMKEAKDAN